VPVLRAVAGQFPAVLSGSVGMVTGGLPEVAGDPLAAENEPGDGESAANESPDSGESGKNV
jgi:hypothetical protein